MDSLSFPGFLRKILAYRRKLRISQAMRAVEKHPHMTVLDIGCGVDGRSFEQFIPDTWRVTGIDRLPPDRIHHDHPNFTYIQTEATDLQQFSDKSFDLVVSVGMLEHITEPSAFQQAIDEIKRVGKQHIVIVPYKYASIEPHYGFPMFGALSRKWQIWFIKLLNLENLRDKIDSDPGYIDRHFLWLSNREYQALFPDSKIFIAPTLDTIAIVG